MKFFRTEQIPGIDAKTIENESIRSIDLMERAACNLTKAIIRHYGKRDIFFAIFAGPGNNGGDALAIARLLDAADEKVEVWPVNPGGKQSKECKQNLLRLRNTSIKIHETNKEFTIPVLPKNSIIIDGLFGSGLNRPLTGIFASIICFINSSNAKIIAIDMPSGLYGETSANDNCGPIVEADITLSVQFPKLSFFFPENERFTGKWEIINIGLDKHAIEEETSNYFFTEENDVSTKLKPRKKFSHKGDYGRGLLIAGSQGMAGASILSAQAALRSGIGLLTLHIPKCNNTIVQTAVPEAMTIQDTEETHISMITAIERYTAIGIGPGIGQSTDTKNALLQLIDKCDKPMVLDADALNIISKNSEYLKKIPENSIITPHVAEFERLAGKSRNSHERLCKAIEMAEKYKIHVILKGAYTAICAPNGQCSFNSTGNPGMATGGSGDVLTGVIAAMLACGYDSHTASIIATYVHGLAGDIAATKSGETSLTAGDIVNALPEAWKRLESVNRKTTVL